MTNSPIETSAEQVSDVRLREIVEDNFWPTRDRVLPLWNSNEAITRKEVVAIARELLSARTSTAVAWVVQLKYADRWSGEMLTDFLPENEGTYRVIRALYASPPPPQPGVRVTEEMVEKAVEAVVAAMATPEFDAADSDGNDRVEIMVRAALTASIPDSGEPG